LYTNFSTFEVRFYWFALEELYHAIVAIRLHKMDQEHFIICNDNIIVRKDSGDNDDDDNSIQLDDPQNEHDFDFEVLSSDRVENRGITQPRGMSKMQLRLRKLKQNTRFGKMDRLYDSDSVLVLGDDDNNSHADTDDESHAESDNPLLGDVEARRVKMQLRFKKLRKNNRHVNMMDRLHASDSALMLGEEEDDDEEEGTDSPRNEMWFKSRHPRSSSMTVSKMDKQLHRRFEKKEGNLSVLGALMRVGQLNTSGNNPKDIMNSRSLLFRDHCNRSASSSSSSASSSFSSLLDKGSLFLNNE